MDLAPRLTVIALEEIEDLHRARRRAFWLGCTCGAIVAFAIVIVARILA